MKLIFTNDIGVNLDSANLMCFYYLKNYYPYEIWDVSKIFGRNGTVKNIESTISINSLEDFQNRLAECVRQDQIVILTNMVEKPWKKLEGIVRKYNVPVICTQKNVFYEMLQTMAGLDFTTKIPIKHRIGCLVRKYRFTRTVYEIIKHEDVKYDFLIGAYNSKPEIVKHFIKAHNVKYDEYLENINTKNPIGAKYILFIDCALCFHPIDYKEPDPHFQKDHYVKQLNEYFQLLEKKYNLPVVISLHPVSAGILGEETFQGRKVSYGKTALLIHHAEFVVCHYSTSLINVVLENKPTVIIGSNEIENSNRRYAQACANILANMCNFAKDSLDDPQLPEPIVNQEKYRRFMGKYIVNIEKKDMSNGEILLNLLNNIENKKVNL